MNWLLIVILAVIIANVAWGYHKGFMRVALSLVSWVIVLAACYLATPLVAEGIVKNTPIPEVVHDVVNEKINEAIAESTGNVADSELVAAVEEKIPAQLLESILGEHESLAELITSAGVVDVDTTELSNAASYLVALLVVIIVTRIALIFVEMFLGLISKLPLIGQADTLLGIAAGALKGLIWSWLVLTVIAVLAYTGANTELMTLVNGSQILTWLYENNPILMAVGSVL